MAIIIHKTNYRYGIHYGSCLSTDVKPTTWAAGSTLYETDTGYLFLYTGSAWVRKYDSVLLATTPSIDIGDVQILAGTAHIGKVEVDTALPAGSNNIGKVDINSNAALVAGEAHLGEVGGNTLPIVVTPVIGAAAFHAKDIVGGKLTLANAARVAAGTGIWHSLTLVDAAKQNVELGVYLFSGDITVAADNAAEALSAADALKFIGHKIVYASDYRTLANVSVASIQIGIPYKVDSGTALYAFIRTAGTPTYTENCLQLMFGMLRD